MKRAPENVIPAPLWLLALITFSGTLAMHIFVPALPQAGDALGAAPGAMQATVSLYILGLAFGQLIYGPLSDRYGRRRVLMAGLVLYTIAGLGAALSQGVEALIVARLFQALGGCAGLVLGRAMVRDTSAPNETVRRLALMNLMVTLSPSGAPLLGTLLETVFGWRSILWFLCGFGVLNLLAAWRLLSETSRPGPTAGIPVLLQQNLQLLRSRRFLCYALGGGGVTTAIYAFIAAAPFIFVNQLQRPSHEVGFYLCMLVSGVWLGSMAASRLIQRISIERLLALGTVTSLLASVSLLGIVLADRLDPAFAVGTMFFFSMGIGLASPGALTLSMGVNPAIIGSASGLYGFVQMALGALSTLLAGLGSDPALAAGIVLTATCAIAQVLFWIARRSKE